MFSKEYQQEIEQNFQEQMQLLTPIQERITQTMQTLTPDEATAMRFLYSAMPISDALDYPPELFAAYARHGVFLWEKGPFAGKVPERIFANYVLHHRANNEDLTDDREFFYHKLSDRIQGKSMYDSTIEANYWCAEEGSYSSTDYRTESPMTLYRSATGRCGEESSFAVAVLRSIGIPARQVYVPLWAHCDDNHAWVEAWCDGKWYFFGACEPEEALNRGWFAAAAARAMLVQSRWFGKEEPMDDTIGQQGMSRILNHLGNYSTENLVQVRVVDAEGIPVPGARVRFSVLNFAAIGSIATVTADSTGVATLKSGRGTLHVSVQKDGGYSETFVEAGEDRIWELRLGGEVETTGEWVHFDMHAPAPAPDAEEEITEEQKERGEQRAKEAADRRAQKIQDFYQEERVEGVLADWQEPLKSELRDILKKSRGNLDEIIAFLSSDPKGQYPAERKASILKSLREKDYWDVTCGVLEESCIEAQAFAGRVPEEIFDKYLLCPRVSYETLRPYRRFLRTYLSPEDQESFRQNPASVPTWVAAHVVPRQDLEYGNLLTSAEGCLLGGIGGISAQKLTCVQIYRALGIPARLNMMDQNVEYYENGSFIPAKAQESNQQTQMPSEEKNATLVLREAGEKMEYFGNVSLTRFKNGSFEWLHLEPEGAGENGVQAAESDDLKVALAPGIYRLITTSRKTNGDQLAQRMTFRMEAGETKEIDLFCRNAQMEEEGERPVVEDRMLHTISGETVSLQQLADHDRALFLWLEERAEPTEHILNELWDSREDFAQMSDPIYFVVRSKEALQHVAVSRLLEKLPTITVLTDSFGAEYGSMAKALGQEPDKLPLIAVLNRSLECIYTVAGYNVGTAKMLRRILK